MPVLKNVQRYLKHIFVPRKSNNQRPKILHPAGLSVIIGIFLLNYSLRFLINSLPGFVLGFSSSITTEEIINATNQERAKSGLSPLSQNPLLTQAASAKAVDMLNTDYWAHISPSGVQPWAFIKNTGYSYRYAGENLGRDFANTNDLVNAWMTSASHRENILNSKYQEIGIAVVDGNLQGIETRLVVQMFGTPTPVPIAQTQPSTPNITPLQQEASSVKTTQPILEEISVPENVKDSIQIAQLEQTDFGKNQEIKPQYPRTNILQSFSQPETKAIVISPTQITQVFGMILVVLLLGTLIADWMVAHKRQMVRLVGKNWAHLSFLGAVIIMMLEYAQGRIL